MGLTLTRMNVTIPYSLYMDKLAPFHLDGNDDDCIGMTPIIARELEFSVYHQRKHLEALSTLTSLPCSRLSRSVFD